MKCAIWYHTDRRRLKSVNIPEVFVYQVIYLQMSTRGSLW